MNNSPSILYEDLQEDNVDSTSDDDYWNNSDNNHDDDDDTPLNPPYSTEANQRQSDGWDAPYDYTLFGAFQDIGSGEEIDDLIESRTIYFDDWNEVIVDIRKKNEVPV